MLKSGTYFLSGNEACAEGAIAAGCRFFAGYPITPSSEIGERMAENMPMVNGVFVQMEDELASIGAVLGASWAGVKAMTATSGPGFSLMQEHIGFAIATETPCVIVDSQRGSPGTGVVAAPMQGDVFQSRWGHHGGMELIALAPSTVQEMFDLMVECFNLSEAYRTPVILLADAFLSHLSEKLRVPKKVKLVERKKPNVKPEKLRPFLAPKGVAPMPRFGQGYRFLVTSTSHDETGMDSNDAESHYKLVERLNNKILRDKGKLTKIETRQLDDAEVAVISYGTPARCVLSAVKTAREEGIKAGYVRLITIWPFNNEMIGKMLEHVNKIIVVELNFGQIVREVQRSVEAKSEVYFVPEIAKLPTPQKILNKIREVCT